MATEALLPDFVFALASTLAAAVMAYGLRLVIDWIKSARKRVVVCYTLVLALLVTGAIPVYYISIWFLGLTPSQVQFRAAFCAWLAQLVAGYLLYRLVREDIAEKQYDDVSQKIKVKKAGVRPATVNVRCIRSLLSDADIRMKLNWKTFSDGVEFLIEQVRARSGGGPHICVGINNAGTAIASLVAGALGQTNPIPVASIVTKGNNAGVNGMRVSVPDKEDANRVLVIDMEMKSGCGVKRVISYLRKEYRLKLDQFDIAVLVASQVRGQINDIKQLRTQGVFEVEDDYLPDYVAFVSDSRVTLEHEVQ